jgi:hypothetical protein
VRHQALRGQRHADAHHDPSRSHAEACRRQHRTAALDRHRHDVRAGLDRQLERATLERRHLALAAARAFREGADAGAALHGPDRCMQLPRRVARAGAFDEHHAHRPRVPAHERHLRQLLLEYEAHRHRQRAEQRADVDHRLVVGHEHVRFRPVDALQPMHLESGAGAVQQSGRPAARGHPQRPVAPAGEQAHQQRQADPAGGPEQGEQQLQRVEQRPDEALHARGPEGFMAGHPC